MIKSFNKYMLSCELVCCWASVEDGGEKFKQYWFKMFNLLVFLGQNCFKLNTIARERQLQENVHIHVYAILLCKKN